MSYHIRFLLIMKCCLLRNINSLKLISNMDRPSSYAELPDIRTRNARLVEENVQLRRSLNRVSLNQQTNSKEYVDATVKARQMEEQRDGISEKFEKLKKKYDTLVKDFEAQESRCKTLEREFQVQKTHTGLVMKSTVDQRNLEQQIILDKRLSEQRKQSDLEVDLLRTQLEKLKMERVDNIDEVDLLNLENRGLRRELSELKEQLARGAEAGVVPGAPPKYEPAVPVAAPRARRDYRHNVVSLCNSDYCFNKNDDGNRATRTQSFIQTSDVLSNCQRRERLRSRFQRTIHDKLEKEEREDKEFIEANS